MLGVEDLKAGRRWVGGAGDAIEAEGGGPPNSILSLASGLG